MSVKFSACRDADVPTSALAGSLDSMKKGLKKLVGKDKEGTYRIISLFLFFPTAKLCISGPTRHGMRSAHNVQ